MRSSVATPIYYSTKLTGLTPGTTYHYRVRHSGGSTADSTFSTAPGGDEPFRFTAFGDESVSSSAVSIMNGVISQNPVFHLHAGDLSYAGGSSSTWDNYLAQIEPLSSRVPWMISYGNHEQESGFDYHGYSGVQARFPNTLTTNSNVYYAFRYRNVGVIALDSNEQSYEYTSSFNWTAGAQPSWLTSKLAEFRAIGSGVDFIVVHFHFCPYCTNTTHPSDLRTRNAWSAIFDTYGVDVVLNGHNHCYERMYPIKANAVVDNTVGNNGVITDANRGPVYVCTGGGGQSLYTGFYAAGAARARGAGGLVTDTIQNFHAYRNATYQYMVVNVTPATSENPIATMQLRSINATGATLDTFTVQRTPAAPPVTVPEFALPAGAAVAGGAVLAGAAYVANRSRLQDEARATHGG